MPPADDRPAIGMVDVERRLRRLGELRAGIVVGPRVALFEHDVALGQHVRSLSTRPVMRSASNSISLEVVARRRAGNSRCSRGVVNAFSWPPMAATTLENRPAGFFSVPLNIRCSRKCARPDLPGVFVGGADAVPDHVGDDRRAVVGDHHDFEPVRERELGDLGPAVGVPGGRRSWRFRRRARQGRIKNRGTG